MKVNSINVPVQFFCNLIKVLNFERLAGSWDELYNVASTAAC